MGLIFNGRVAGGPCALPFGDISRKEPCFVSSLETMEYPVPVRAAGRALIASALIQREENLAAGFGLAV